ncbi:MAG TPA: methyltransferase domain-containing protein [Caulobacteraceae bacterium]|jgi:malonyl-CoA O-methyltransferase
MSRVADRFGRAAATYESATPIQREVAGRLAGMILASGPAAEARVAEFGCGTGYLARALAAPLQPGLWVATDLAPAMAAAARASTPLVAVMDAARPALKPGFDLVCSSLTLQWLAEPAAAVRAWRGLARPGGRLAVATLLDGSFAEWRAALAQAGARSVGPAFPSLEEARAWFAPDADVRTVILGERHQSALAFLRALRAAGTDAAESGAQESGALGSGVMRRAMAAFDARGAAVAYRVLLAVETVA